MASGTQEHCIGLSALKLWKTQVMLLYSPVNE